MMDATTRTQIARKAIEAGRALGSANEDLVLAAQNGDVLGIAAATDRRSQALGALDVLSSLYVEGTGTILSTLEIDNVLSA